MSALRALLVGFAFASAMPPQGALERFLGSRVDGSRLTTCKRQLGLRLTRGAPAQSFQLTHGVRTKHRDVWLGLRQVSQPPLIGEPRAPVLFHQRLIEA